MLRFKFNRQTSNNDCGASCIKMICDYYDVKITKEFIRQHIFFQKEGISVNQILNLFNLIDFKTTSKIVQIDQFVNCPLPCIIQWGDSHFVVLLKFGKTKILVADPEKKIYYVKYEDFLEKWEGSQKIAIFAMPSPMLAFRESNKPYGFRDFSRYILSQKKMFPHIFVGIGVSFILSIFLPFIGQSIIDVGIQYNDLSFVQLMLIAQTILVLSSTLLSFLSVWINLNLNYRTSLASSYDFIKKNIDLPISYLNGFTLGGLLQRMGDLGRVQNYISSIIFSSIFQIGNLIIFSTILIMFDIKFFILLIFFILLSFGWQYIFLNKRRRLDIEAFEIGSKSQTNTIEILSNNLDIKLANAQLHFQNKWEGFQEDAFNLSKRSLYLAQQQSIGQQVIDQVRSICFTYLSASLVISGHITLGMMFSISYIMGQVQSPFSFILGLILSKQDAKISLERLGEILNPPSEETLINKSITSAISTQSFTKDIIIENLDFSYQGHHDNLNLKNISMTIPYGKFIGIVGGSGSGKSTLLKLLAKLYKPINGDIKIGNLSLFQISNKEWRENISIMLQENYIFEASIIDNIAFGDNDVDMERIIHVCEIVEISVFIESLPNGYESIIGGTFISISQGQKQRVLFARALYKNSKYIFLDEATNCLDMITERNIISNIKKHLKDVTIVMVAHRLSTVADASIIYVFKDGEIIEKGSHKTLMKANGEYKSLYKAQNYQHEFN